MNRNNFAPVKEGDELEVTIEAVGEKGDGIAKVDGFVLFVPKAQQGERIKVRVTRVLKNVGFAEKVGEAETPAKEPQETSEEAVPQETYEEPQQSYEDTEDFGEEPKEEAAPEEEPQEDKEEAPEEEAAPEEPTEETPEEEPQEE